MEARFSRSMGYEVTETPSAPYPREAYAQIPMDALSALATASAISRSRIEEITGHPILRLEEDGSNIGLEVEGSDSLPVDDSELALHGEMALLFERVSRSLRAGHDISFGRLTYQRRQFSDLVTILITHRDSGFQKPRFIHSENLFISQAAILITTLYPQATGPSGVDEREELRSGLIRHIEEGDRVALHPTLRLN